LIPLLGALIALALPLYAWRARGRQYGMFTGVMVLISFPMAVVLATRLQDLVGPVVGWLFVYAFCAAGLHAMRLVNAKLRPRFYRYAISLPGMALQALGAISLPYFVVMLPIRGALWWTGAESALESLLWLDLLPVAVIAASVVSSFTLRREIVRFDLGAEGPDEIRRMPVERHRRAAPELEERPLRIVQITDPHIGPWQPIHRLQNRLEEFIAHDPDLVLLTGDFLTMEGNGTPGCLTEALAPLRQLEGRCFASFGNHDHEAPEEVRAAMTANGIRLLVDDGTVTTTPVGPVQILGADYHRGDRAERLTELFAAHPRIEDHLRILLLHDPLHFRDVGKGEADLTLSGHTHGGQIGLVSLGLDWTVLSRSRWPDHGLFGHGPSRLYVHRGTGFYGFPLRVGVPGEASLMELTLANR
jgi:hypothetical protein